MTIEGLLLDIDGVLVVSWQPLPGAIEAVASLRASGRPVRFLTNTTTKSRASLAASLVEAGFDIEPDEIVTAPAATAAYLRRGHPGRKVFLIAKGDVAADFEGIDLAEEAAEVVVVGGAEERFSYETLNRAFRLLQAGAAFVAMHRNLWWMTETGPQLDAGAFIVALEAASQVEAEVAGKPARSFFQSAVELLGTDPARTAMVGDDLEADVLGAQRAGLVGVLVKTGKFRPEQLTQAAQQPDHVIGSIAELPPLLSSGAAPAGEAGSQAGVP